MLTRRALLQLGAVLPVIAREDVAVPAHALEGLPAPVPAMELTPSPVVFVDHDGWILTAEDRDALAAVDGTALPGAHPGT